MAEHVVADTTSGKIRGIVSAGVNVFKGIPYAVPPEGARRFMPPVKPLAWTGVGDALTLGDRAMQDDSAFGLAPEIHRLLDVSEVGPMSENCLVLNVWTPAVNDGRKRPVMFWCHGGAFIAGSGGASWYDGTNLCLRGDVVVVTVNHRLGAFGHLYLGELGGEEFASSGNSGMLDLIAALEWVRDNIASFAGDPGNVTIFGESGGGAKVSVLMAMPAAHGLFHRAIVQSGPGVEMMSRESETETARQVLAELGLGAGDIDELRRIPAARLLEAQIAVLKRVSLMSFAHRRLLGFNPIVNGRHLPANPFEPVAPAHSAQIPLMIGSTKDEMSLFFGLAPWIDGMDEATLRERTRMFVGKRSDDVLDAYRRARPTDSNRDLLLAITTDLGIRIPSLTTADRKAAQRAAPVYVYMFAWETPVLGGKLKSPHALEIPFVFDTVRDSAIAGDAPTRFALAEKMSKTWIAFARSGNPNNEKMSKTWIAFARSGNPNNDGIPEWPAYSVEQRADDDFRRCVPGRARSLSDRAPRLGRQVGFAHRRGSSSETIDPWHNVSVEDVANLLANDCSLIA